ncbi:MAG: isochorismatase family protein, partial [Candidatus Omnitrophica bacterium]|nr:isochorismatase family protein [Candidatus Omnitrophota bacterium]
MPKLCIKGSEGWEFYKIKPELEKGEKVFSKNKYDAFENQLLKEYLFSKNIKYILITGVTTDNCIKAAFDSNLVKVKRYVIGDCVSTAGYKLLTSHLTTLKYFKERNTLIWLSQISFSSSSPHTVSATPYSIKEELVQLIIGTRYQDEFIRLAQEEMTKFYKISSGSSCLSSFSRLLKRLKDNFENTKDKYKFADSVPYADKILILIVMTDSSFGEVLPTNCLRWAERFSTLLSGESIDKENREFVRKILKDIAYINIMKSKKGEFFWTEVKFKSNPEIFVFDRLPTFYSDYIKEYPYGYFGRLNSSNKKIAYFYKNSEFYIKVFPKYKEVEPQSLYLERMEKLLLRENISSPIASSIEKNVPINNFERRCSSCSFLDNYERKLTNKVSLAILPVYDNAGKRRKKFYQTFGFFPPEVRERTIYIKNRNFILQELVRFLLKNRYLNIGKIEILAPYYLDSRFLGKVKDLLSLARKIIKRRKVKTDLTLVITTTNIYERISEKASQLIGGAFIEENIAVLSICHLEADSIFSLSESINRNALHEIGHLLGLKHCQNRCVMSKLLNVFGYTEFCPVCQRELYKNFCRPDREYSAKREKNNKTSSTLRVRKRDLFQSVIDKLIQVYFKQRTPQNKKCVDGFCCFIKNEKSFPVKLVSFSSTDLDEVSGEDLILFAKQNYPCDKLGIFFDYKDNKLYILTKCTDYHKRPARCREYPESRIFSYECCEYQSFLEGRMKYLYILFEDALRDNSIVNVSDEIKKGGIYFTKKAFRFLKEVFKEKSINTEGINFSSFVILLPEKRKEVSFYGGISRKNTLKSTIRGSSSPVYFGRKSLKDEDIPSLLSRCFEKVEEERNKAGISISELCRKSGVKLSTYEFIRLGRRRPINPVFILNLLKYFGLEKRLSPQERELLNKALRMGTKGVRKLLRDEDRIIPKRVWREVIRQLKNIGRKRLKEVSKKLNIPSHTLRSWKKEESQPLHPIYIKRILQYFNLLNELFQEERQRLNRKIREIDKTSYYQQRKNSLRKIAKEIGSSHQTVKDIIVRIKERERKILKGVELGILTVEVKREGKVSRITLVKRLSIRSITEEEAYVLTLFFNNIRPYRAIIKAIEYRKKYPQIPITEKILLSWKGIGKKTIEQIKKYVDLEENNNSFIQTSSSSVSSDTDNKPKKVKENIEKINRILLRKGKNRNSYRFSAF